MFQTVPYPEIFLNLLPSSFDRAARRYYLPKVLRGLDAEDVDGDEGAAGEELDMIYKLFR